MNTTFSPQQRSGLVGGIALIVIGIFAFAAQFLRSENMAVVILGGLALIFAVWGFVARNGGLFVPAGILTGVAAGIWLVQTTMFQLAEEPRGGLMVLSIAGGFALITILWYLALQELHWWPLVVAAILAFVGAAIWIGGTALEMLTVVGQAWPLILVIIGGIILWRAFRRQAQ